jgi:hypothetical protein
MAHLHLQGHFTMLFEVSVTTLPGQLCAKLDRVGNVGWPWAFSFLWLILFLISLEAGFTKSRQGYFYLSSVFSHLPQRVQGSCFLLLSSFFHLIQARPVLQLMTVGFGHNASFLGPKWDI